MDWQVTLGLFALRALVARCCVDNWRINWYGRRSALRKRGCDRPSKLHILWLQFTDIELSFAKPFDGQANMTFRLALSFLYIALIPSHCLAADDPRRPKPCESGHIFTQHRTASYDFATTSWERAERNAFIYRTCVENHDVQKSLFGLDPPWSVQVISRARAIPTSVHDHSQLIRPRMSPVA